MDVAVIFFLVLPESADDFYILTLSFKKELIVWSIAGSEWKRSGPPWLSISFLFLSMHGASEISAVLEFPINSLQVLQSMPSLLHTSRCMGNNQNAFYYCIYIIFWKRRRSMFSFLSLFFLIFFKVANVFNYWPPSPWGYSRLQVLVMKDKGDTREVYLIKVAIPFPSKISNLLFKHFFCVPVVCEVCVPAMFYVWWWSYSLRYSSNYVVKILDC